MIRYRTIAERARHAAAAEYADEQRSRLDAIGLGASNDNLEAVLDENERQWKERALIERDMRRPTSTWAPELLQRKTVEEYAVVDGAFDATIGRPPSAAFRFVESSLHVNNYPHLSAYLQAYVQAFNEQKARLK